MTLLGIDEAGRGPLAGPVMAAGVVLSDAQKAFLLEMGLRDSKKLSAKKREKIFQAMNEIGVVWCAQAASPFRIDRDNILQATLWAMSKAVNRMPCVFDGVVVDGNREIPGIDYYQQAVVGADDIYPEVSAASVVAKVLRDRAMVVFGELWPEYGFDSHKGYGTKAHVEALRNYGPTPIHRRSFSW